MKKVYLFSVIFLIFASACSNTKVDIKNIKVDCLDDGDCVLIDSLALDNCCGANACGSIDYSQDKYIAVNKESYSSALNKLHEACFGKSDPNSGEYKEKMIKKCGPMKGCPVIDSATDFLAKCVEGTCKKSTN